MSKCKYCQAELPEETTICPACGKDNREEPKKRNSGRIALVVAAVVVLSVLT